MQIRLGKGFISDELKKSKILRKLVKTIGIAVDHRRNWCTESLQANLEQLKLYMSKLLLFPEKSGAKGVRKGDAPRRAAECRVFQPVMGTKMPQPDDVCPKNLEIEEFSSKKKLHKFLNWGYSRH